MRKFTTLFLEEVMDFLDTLDEGAREKILYTIDKAEQTNDPRLFKKLTKEIWEFRVNYGVQYRLFAFWDKRNNAETLVICTHGIIKKTDKTPVKAIEKATRIRKFYLEIP